MLETTGRSLSRLTLCFKTADAAFIWVLIVHNWYLLELLNFIFEASKISFEIVISSVMSADLILVIVFWVSLTSYAQDMCNHFSISVLNCSLALLGLLSAVEKRSKKIRWNRGLSCSCCFWNWTLLDYQFEAFEAFVFIFSPSWRIALDCSLASLAFLFYVLWCGKATKKIIRNGCNWKWTIFEFLDFIFGTW